MRREEGHGDLSCSDLAFLSRCLCAKERAVKLTAQMDDSHLCDMVRSADSTDAVFPSVVVVIVSYRMHMILWSESLLRACSQRAFLNPIRQDVVSACLLGELAKMFGGGDPFNFRVR